ncbi:response regulator [Paenibacillus nanensis]|uniref:Response regulator n=1 Tax=Paenibacillus nanensis TaxID=393251 RepID=A0A3A1UU67_9BACL|nr:response regulator [Paenibacillus nanensis]RIX52078.1 response regulator [Paenibacillus nanensis]
MIRALLIDDEEIALDVMEILLEQIGDVTIAGKYQRVSEAIAQAAELKPDIIFLDIEMPGMNGLDAGKQLFEQCPSADLVYVTAYHQYAVEAFESNAIGYLLKPVTGEQLANTLARYKTLRAREAIRLKEPAPLENNGYRPTAARKRNLRLHVMGSLELYDREGKAVTWRTQKTKELFACLWCFHDAPFTRFQIIDRLWPEIELDRAQALFHTTLYNLRSMLKAEGFPDMVMFENGRYWMQTGRIDSDIERLREIMRHTDKSAADEALALYRGDLLEMEYYQWADGHRNELRSDYLFYLKRMSDTAQGHNRTKLLWKLLELDPYRTGTAEALLEHLQETGDAAGVNILEKRKRQLMQELGVDKL